MLSHNLSIAKVQNSTFSNVNFNTLFTGPDARHLHEGWVLADAEEGAGQREEPQGAHDPLRHAAQGETDFYFECTEMATKIRHRFRDSRNLGAFLISRIFETVFSCNLLTSSFIKTSSLSLAGGRLVDGQGAPGGRRQRERRRRGRTRYEGC